MPAWGIYSLPGNIQMQPLSRHDITLCLQEAAKHLTGLQGIKSRYRAYVCPLASVVELIPEGASMFDIGCGSGTLLHLGKHFRHLEKASGYDISSQAVKSSEVFDGIDVRLRSAEQPLPSLSGYDLITMIDVLHHIAPAQQDRFLTDVVRNMDAGSRLVIADINAAQRVGAALNQLHDLLLAREWVHPRSPDAVLRVLQAAGCRREHVSLHRSLWYPHYLIRVIKVAANKG